ncbi:hypothetical protein AC578_4511 [Pseudocercospora eumusae]|uniref:Uncharacterized protein n=1 Tax=Pseudocercospora eumusae TaxID=321146 RepID=A0A139GWF5_9PEZI|nr:hypothetical protein AC578_4511 [Pseudocercospora eumusae]
MSRNYSVVEPHPTVPKSGGYVGGGRGGAGNFKRYKSEEITDGQNASGPASRITLSRPFRRNIPAGRGGAGNMFSETEESIFQFDEELLKYRQNSTPVYRIGRGGAGNMVNENKAISLSRKDSTDSSASAASEASERISRLSISSIFSRRS